jgi:hypothetical protein
MDVRRGLLRLWVFVSALWIAAIIGIGWTIAPKNLTNTPYQYVYEARSDVDLSKPRALDKSIYEIMRSPSKEGLKPIFSELGAEYWSQWDEHVQEGSMQVFTYPDDGKLYLDTSLTADDIAYIEKAFVDSKWKRWGLIILKWAAIAVAAPIVLLVLGAGLFWVAKGFVR